MTIQKDLKRVVRSRMKKTGESYTAARLQLLKKKEQPPDYAAIGGKSDAAVKERTGHTWAEWVRILDSAGAAKMEHRDIAALLDARGVPGWWAQTVTVGYERIRGLRAKGQRRGGLWEASKSRTFPVPVEKLFAAFSSASRRKRWLDTKITVRSATSPKYMHITWPDGTSVDVGFTAKGASKSAVAVAHMKLRSKEDVDRMKAFWSERFDALGEVLR